MEKFVSHHVAPAREDHRYNGQLKQWVRFFKSAIGITFEAGLLPTEAHLRCLRRSASLLRGVGSAGCFDDTPQHGMTFQSLADRGRIRIC